MGGETTQADPYHIVVSPDNTGLLKLRQTGDASRKVSKLLQEDLEKHHVFFNDSGFHNHIPHQLFSLYGTGATADIIQSAYKDNESYQRPAKPHAPAVSSWDEARQSLGKGDNYALFLRHFQEDIAARGWQAVLVDRVLSGSPDADDMLVRTFAGFLHPLIQLMYGVEWDQPAVVAEGLAQVAVHRPDDLARLLLGAERRSRERQTGQQMPRILELYRAVGRDELLRACVTDDMQSKINEGVLATPERFDAMEEIMSRVSVEPAELDERTAEMFDAALFVGASAAAHPVKYPKFDFFLMHHINSAPIFLSINAQEQIPKAAKVRMLEWKIRMDLLQYAARACPPLDVERIKVHESYRIGSDPLAIISRIHQKSEDGHAIKLGRAALICQRLTQPYEDRDWVQIKGDDLWQLVHGMIVTSVVPETPGFDENFVRTTGLEEPWKNVPIMKNRL